MAMLIPPGRCSDELHATGRRCFEAKGEYTKHDFLKRPESAPPVSRPAMLHKNFETPVDQRTWGTRAAPRITEFSRAARTGVWRKVVAGDVKAPRSDGTPIPRSTSPHFAAFHRQVQADNNGVRYACLSSSYGIDLKDRKAYISASRAGWYSNETMFKSPSATSTPFSDVLLANHTGLLAKTLRNKDDKAAREKRRRAARLEARQDALFGPEICSPQIALFEKKLKRWRKRDAACGAVESTSVSSDDDTL